MATQELIGRDPQLEDLAVWLGDTSRLPCITCRRGRTGHRQDLAGARTVAEAERLGYQVLAASPVEPESRLAYAALGDLLGGSLDDVLPARSPSRSGSALEAALLLPPRRGPSTRGARGRHRGAERAASDGGDAPGPRRPRRRPVARHRDRRCAALRAPAPSDGAGRDRARATGVRRSAHWGSLPRACRPRSRCRSDRCPSGRSMRSSSSGRPRSCHGPCCAACMTCRAATRSTPSSWRVGSPTGASGSSLARRCRATCGTLVDARIADLPG